LTAYLHFGAARMLTTPHASPEGIQEAVTTLMSSRAGWPQN